ncbi:MAG: amidohydrolase family protein [Pontiellaceae bacterium]|nr:amidohydrolase family protein [Pontiellaceae bacterium]MBN2784044.1 amidohydrolase family protein [Pontiellaceae bacterium]
MAILIRDVVLGGEVRDVKIEGNRFSQMGSTLDCSADTLIDGAGFALVPTFVNAHTHAAMTLLRGYADDLELHEWLTQHIWPLEAQLSEEDIYHGTRLACLEMIRSGTTCFNDMYWHLHGTARAVTEMGLRAVLSSVFIDFFDEQKAIEQQALTRELHNECENYSDRIRFALGPHAIYTVSESSLCWAKAYADENELLLHIHVSETEKEVQDCLDLHGLRPVEWLDRIGLLGSNVIAAHVVHATDAEIGILAERGVKVVHNPVSNMKLASGSFRYSSMIDGGVSVSLGTDGCSSNNNLDMLEEMKVAALHAKLVERDPTVLPAAEAFRMATMNGARALGIDCGEIAVGRLADCMLVDFKHPRLAPGYDLIDDLVYSADSSCVDTVICDGKILMRHGRIEGEEQIVEEARNYAKRFGR